VIGDILKISLQNYLTLINNQLEQVLFTLKDAKVGDAAQFTSYISADYYIGRSSIDFGYRFIDNLYADYNIVDDVFKTPDNVGALKFHLMVLLMQVLLQDLVRLHYE
jgi:hypothetical protein